MVVGNKHSIAVTSIGAVTLPHKLHLNNVLVSSSLMKNLISICQFTSDNNYYVEFDPLGLCEESSLSERDHQVQ